MSTKNKFSMGQGGAWRRAGMLCLALIACLSLTHGGAAQSPLPTSPLVPTPYSSPQFHAGGVITPFPYLPGPTLINPLYGQSQGTPTGLVAGPLATEIPSFLLGNYDPTRPPGVTLPTNYFPNHFRDGTFFSWSAPLSYIASPSPTALGTYNTAGSAADPTFVALNHDVQSTPAAVNWTEYPDITAASYLGTTAGTISTPDAVPHTGTPATAADGAHAIRQLVYFGRAEYILDTVTGSATLGKLIRVGAIYCADGFTGAIVWRYQVPHIIVDAATKYVDPSSNTYGDPSVFSTPAVVKINVLTDPAGPTYANKLVVIVGDNNGYVYCLNAVGNGDGTSNSNSIDAVNNQPYYTAASATAAGGSAAALGTTKTYWVYRPDPAQPRDGTGAATATDATANLPVPGPFGIASPNVYINQRLAGTPAVSNAVVYIGSRRGVLYALDAQGVPNTNPHYNASLSAAVTGIPATVPTCNPLWWFWPGGTANPNVSMEATPAISPPNPLPSITVLTSSANPSLDGLPTWTATVSDGTGGTGVPTGTVTFTVDGAAGAPVTLAGGTATATPTTALTPGYHVISAAYSGDANYAGSNSLAFSQAVIGTAVGTSFTVITSSVNPTDPATAVTFTATVTDGPTGGAGPTGTAIFTIDGTAGTAVVLTAGVAASVPVTLTPGSHTVTVAYSGDGTYAATTSPVFSQFIFAPLVPTVYIGTSSEMGLNSNAGRLYAVNGLVGPKGNGGSVTTPGTPNYNVDQRPLWAYPNAYASGAGNVGGLGIRPALGNVSGSPVVFTNPDVSPAQTRIYLAADVGLETPFTPPGGTPATAPAPRPGTDQTGRVWAVNTVGTTAMTPDGQVWVYPIANDPNDSTKDNVPEPNPPIGAFLRATPAMGIVQFPTTIQNGGGSAYVHTDTVHTSATGVNGQSVPMLYIGTNGVGDFGFYALDVDGQYDPLSAAADKDSRDIYRLESPSGAGFASSPALVANPSTTSGNGGVVYATAGNSLFQFGATPITNLDATQAFPFISVDKTFVGFGPVSSPTVAAADVSDLTPTGALPAYDAGKNATDWVYVGDSTSGFCRGITPLDATDLATIPTPEFGGTVDTQPPLSIDARYPLREYLFDGSATQPADNLDMSKAAPTGPDSTVTPFEWGQFAFVRIANVVPPTAPDPANLATTTVQDPNDPTIYYANGGAVTFRVGDVSNPVAFAPTETVPATLLPTLHPATNPLSAKDNGFIQRTGPLRADEPATQSLLSPPAGAGSTGEGWVAAYSYPIGSYRTRSGDTPGARRQVTEARQTANAYKSTDGGATFTLTGTVTLEAQTLLGSQYGTATAGMTQTKPTVQPTFGILNPLALRGAGLPYNLGTAVTATPPGDTEGVGPFRGVDTTLPAGSLDLQALSNGNEVYTQKAPPSGYDVTQDPTQASKNNQGTAGAYPQAYRFIATSLGLIHDGSVGDNHDPGNSTAPTGFKGNGDPNGLPAGANSGAASNYGPYMLNVADRSEIGLNLTVMDPFNPTNVLFPQFTIAMQRARAHWNDNTGFNGPGACVNRLPWEDLPTASGMNTSRDYPDILPDTITHSLITATGTTEITGRYGSGTSPDPAQPSGADATFRLITPDPIQIAMSVPSHQPANLQAWDASNYLSGSPGAITPAQINAGHSTFPEGYVEGAGASQRVFVDLNHNGVWDNNEPEREVQVFSGVAVNMSVSLATPTADIGSVPSGFGVQTGAYTGTPSLGYFTPYTPAFQSYYQPVTALNNGNVNLLDVHFDQQNNSSKGTLLLNADPLDPSTAIPAFDYTGVTGPRTGTFGGGSVPEQAFLLRSSLDTDLGLAYGRNPGILAGGTDPVTGNSIPGQFPALTFHKPQIGSLAGTTLTVPDSPDNATSPYYLLPTNLPTIPAGGVTLKALPYVSVAIPFGQPVGSYSQTLRLFEDMDPTGYSTYAGASQPYNPLYPPQYGGAVGGLGVPGSQSDAYQVGAQPLSDPGTVVKVSVLEDRITDGATFGALPQIDSVSAGAGGVSRPDFAPAALQSAAGLSVYWTSGRGGPYGIYGSHVPYITPGAGSSYFYPGDPTTQWFTQINPSLPAGTNSGLTIAQDVPLLSGSTFTSDSTIAFAFAVNVNTGPYQNALYCYPVTPGTGVLGTGQLVTNDPAQVKYGVRGLYCTGAGFPGNRKLWAFWTASVRGRTAIYYNSREPGTGPWTTAPALLSVPAGLTAVSDPCPELSSGIVGSANTPQYIDVTFSGTGPDGNADLYVCRYLPDATTPSQLDLQTFAPVTEILKPMNGWYQARDAAWSRSGALNISVGGTGLLYDVTNKPLYSKATFDKASGLLVFTFTVDGTTATPTDPTKTLFVDSSTGRVRFVTAPTGPVTATFNPQARRLTEDARADTGVVSFLDPTYKDNAGNIPGGTTLGRVQTDRRWYFWRKAGTTDNTASATVYEKSQRLTVFLPKPVDVTQPITVTVPTGSTAGFVPDVQNVPAVLNADGSVKYPAAARLYLPIYDNTTLLEGQPVTVSYTATDATTPTVTDSIQWQDEMHANDTSSASPVNAAHGLANVLDTQEKFDKNINDNNIAAFLDVNAYNDLSGGSGATDAPHKIWLFWNSARNGTADLYYETINPRF